MANTKPTSASQFKAKARKTKVEGVLMELPSGNFATIRRPSIAELLKNGTIPNTLIGSALRQMSGKGATNQKEIKESIELVDFLLSLSFVEPQLVLENPNESQISLDDLTDEDRGFVFMYVQQGVADLEKFRSK